MSGFLQAVSVGRNRTFQTLRDPARLRAHGRGHATPTCAVHVGIARIPGTRQFLLVGSGDDCSEFQRIFLASISGAAQVFAGTDDENYGAVLRQVAPIL